MKRDENNSKKTGSPPRASDASSSNAAEKEKKEPATHPLPAGTPGEREERPLTQEEEEAEIRRRLKALGYL